MKQINGSLITYTILQPKFQLVAKTPDKGKIILEREVEYTHAILIKTSIWHPKTKSTWTLRNIGHQTTMEKTWARLSQLPQAAEKYSLVQLTSTSIK